VWNPNTRGRHESSAAGRVIHATLSLLLGLSAAMAAEPEIDAARIKADVRTLSSDDFEGRGPGQDGERKTVAYLTAAFAKAGLKPGGERGSWFQEARLARFEREGPAVLHVSVAGSDRDWIAGQDVTVSSRLPGRVRIERAPLVFVGFGVSAPELGWNNFAGVDLHGKVAVFLANDPDFDVPEGGQFGGKLLSYYGRVSYKVEEAQRQGAVAALIIHEMPASRIPWPAYQHADPQPVYDLAPTAAAFGLRGWIAGPAAAALFQAAGLDYASLKTQAHSSQFRAVPIGDAALSVEMTTRVTPFLTRNVVALLRGASRPLETVIYGAHWDTFGVGEPDACGDRIYNGAVDDALGTATLLEIARAFASGPRPQRSVVFIAFTSEEKDLLGSAFYASHPLYPLATTAAMINLDPHIVLSRVRNMELIGGGRTDLEEDLVRWAARDHLRVSPEGTPEAGWYFRSDQFSFARQGVPVLYFRPGQDLEGPGEQVGAAQAADYLARRYHQPSDEFDPAWDLGAAQQQGRLAYELGLELANSRRWPQWKPGTEYKALRDPTQDRRVTVGSTPR
jgi:Zn-dependent M28 family amino/carboxypeptidase